MNSNSDSSKLRVLHVKATVTEAEKSHADKLAYVRRLSTSDYLRNLMHKDWEAVDWKTIERQYQEMRRAEEAERKAARKRMPAAEKATPKKKVAR